MPDGRVVRIVNRNPLEPLMKVLRSQAEDSPEARLLRDAVSVVESGGTHLAELARIMGRLHRERNQNENLKRFRAQVRFPFGGAVYGRWQH